MQKNKIDVDHAQKEANSAKRKLRAPIHLAGTDWGYNKAMLKGTYLAIGRSTMVYAAAAWQPWLSNTGFEKLKATQSAARAITGTTPQRQSTRGK